MANQCLQETHIFLKTSYLVSFKMWMVVPRVRPDPNYAYSLIRTNAQA